MFSENFREYTYSLTILENTLLFLLLLLLYDLNMALTGLRVNLYISVLHNSDRWFL